MWFLKRTHMQWGRRHGRAATQEQERQPDQQTRAMSGFTDADQISSWAMDAMLWANENNILNGDGSGHLIPKGKATRAHVAQMIRNFIKNLEEHI